MNGSNVGNRKRDGGKFTNYAPLEGCLAHVIIWKRLLTESEVKQVFRLIEDET